ncbi:recombinase family protein [Shewanella eurypsychrophilus]|uniref:Recombinase family protein n=1 Tax=Shewanella eurypsychrophilus TaxID=2593656 RepID=A0ABX6V7S1_9GAMM|nr:MULTISPECIES: recombinase family protein [Shewanella]QFU23161.1 helix-turn-helix domain-containing protein [Shewanella sp. YLB-09]QPG58444.1 recombinase family protein [Shewanella eurypsychrophilus]
MAKVGYVRVSSVQQNTDRQLDNVELDKVFTDKCSGGSTNRPALEQLIEYVRSGDTVVVHSIDRLARSIDDLRGMVKSWNNAGITVQFIKEGLVFNAEDTSPIAELMLNMLGSIAQFEKALINERQAEGIAKAKSKGIYTGRKANTAKHSDIKELLVQGMSIRKIAAELDCGVSTVQRVKKEMI